MERNACCDSANVCRPSGRVLTRGGPSRRTRKSSTIRQLAARSLTRSLRQFQPPPSGRPLCSSWRKPPCRGVHYMGQPGLADLVQALSEVIVFGQHAMEVADEKILMPNTLCLQGLANFEREFCALLTACALPPATTALSHHAEALRPTDGERDEYLDGDTDKKRLLLHFDAADDTPLGMLNRFAAHGTSMNNTNKLVSNNNRGCAHILFVQDPNGDALPGLGPYVAHVFSSKRRRRALNTAWAQVSGQELTQRWQHQHHYL